MLNRSVPVILLSLSLFSCIGYAVDRNRKINNTNYLISTAPIPGAYKDTEEEKNSSFISTDPIPGYDMAPRGLVGNISKETFKEVVSDVLDIYAPLAREKGAKLYLRAPGDPQNPERPHPDDITDENYKRDQVLEKMWAINIPNALATKDTSTNLWYLTVFGELARQPELQTESLALIVCHEIGHHFGGFPLRLISPFHGDFIVPLASEGQADYYASQVCVKHFWQDQENSTDPSGRSYKMLAEKSAVDKCDSMYNYSDDRNLCYKIAYAGTHTAHLWHRLAPQGSSPVSNKTPDLTRVDESEQKNYPKPQCRLDTYLSGALCPTELNETCKGNYKIFYDLLNIPGIDHPNGPDSIEARDASRSLTCGTRFLEASRPRCWFHPNYYSDRPYDPISATIFQRGENDGRR